MVLSAIEEKLSKRGKEAVLQRSKRNLTDRVSLEQWSEGSEGSSHVNVWGRKFQANQHQGPDVGAFNRFEESQEAKVAGEELSEWNVTGDRAEKQQQANTMSLTGDIKLFLQHEMECH